MQKIDLNERLKKPAHARLPKEVAKDTGIAPHRKSDRIREQSEERQERKPRRPEQQANPQTMQAEVPPKPEDDGYGEEDALLLEREMLRIRRDKRAEERKRKLHKALTIAIIAACIYVAFLIYGVGNTEYVYDDTGRVVTRIMTVDDIRALEDFSAVAAQYRQARMLYEKALVLDYRIAAGQEEPLLVAPEYDRLLEDVEALSIQLSALDYPAEYSQTVNMLTVWVQNDIAIYCQNISRAISQNNAEYAAHAEEYRTLMYNDFSVITENIATLGYTVKGAEIEDIISWSPEKYVQEEIGGLLYGS